MPLLALYEAFLADRYHLRSQADEIHFVTCADGFRVGVKRFLPAGPPSEQGMPVVCVPGLGADSHNFDAPGAQGLAPFLAQKGHDVWVVDLRGTGQSKAPARKWRQITFDDFVNLDLPAVIQHICDRSGKDEVAWVGHSMGGMVFYALQGTRPDPRIRAAVTIGSPLGFPQGWRVAPILRPLQRLGDYVPGLHVRPLMRFAIPLILSAVDQSSRKFAVRGNVDVEYLRRLAFHTVQSIPRGLMLQFRQWVSEDVFCSADGSLDYRNAVSGIQTPVQVIAGPRDELGTPDAVRRALTLLHNSVYVECSRRHGFSTDYGHLDLVFGRRAHVEVFPRIAAFLKSDVATRRDAAA
jgi:polyhydroxyalkanoate synthase